MATLSALADRLDAATRELEGLRPAIEAGEPWPLTDVYGPGPESSWGPREVLAHVAEMLPYWMGEIERILDGATGEAVPFGRTEADAVRVAIIGRDRTMPSRELLSRVGSDARRVARRLRELPDDDAARVGQHATRGPISVAEIVERFQVGHLEGHVTQLREILAASGASPSR
jgi:DinB superfamily